MPTAKARAARKSGGGYDVHPGVAMMQDWIRTLPAKTGRSVEQWVALVKKEGPPTEAERRDWLRAEHGLGTNTAWWLAERAQGKGGEDDDPESYLKTAADYVEAMYAGKRAALRPIHDALLEASRALGPDVRVCPCKTIVPVYRAHVVAQVKPATNARIDFGLALKGQKVPKRLLDTGGAAKGDRITHRIPLTRVEEVDDEVRRWLKKAYELDAPA
jgi:hypothetical protein